MSERGRSMKPRGHTDDSSVDVAMRDTNRPPPHHGGSAATR